MQAAHASHYYKALMSTSTGLLPQLQLKEINLTNRDKRAPYRPNNPATAANDHCGQRKLHLVEALFLAQVLNQLARNHHWDRVNPMARVIYAGAAPGDHIPALVQLFPMFTYDLWSPPDNQFVEALTEVTQVSLHQDYFTAEAAKTYLDDPLPLVFISDIRTVSAGRSKPSNQDVIENNQLQLSWVRLLNPVSAMLKFRPPFPDRNTATGDDYNYVRGALWKQPWAPVESAEVRLVLTGNYYDTMTYSRRQHEEVMAYHNTVARPQRYLNPVTNANAPIAATVPNNWDGVMTLNIYAYVAFVLNTYGFRVIPGTKTGAGLALLNEDTANLPETVCTMASRGGGRGAVRMNPKAKSRVQIYPTLIVNLAERRA